MPLLIWKILRNLKGYSTHKWKFPQVVANLYEFLFCKIFWRTIGTKQLFGTIDFHSRKKKYYGNQWWQIFNCSIFLCVQQKKETPTGLQQLEGEQWQNFHFWVEYPFKGIVHSKIVIMSSFTHPQVVPIFLLLNTKKDILKNVGNQTMTPIVWRTKPFGPVNQQFGFQHCSKYFLLCSAEDRNSWRFGTTWRWVNDDRIFIFRWTIHFILTQLWRFLSVTTQVGVHCAL